MKEIQESELICKIKEVIAILRINHIPSVTELENIGERRLATAIGRNGGFIHLAEVMGFPTKKQDKLSNSNRIWTDEIIKENIISIKNDLNISWMPTRNDIARHEGNDCLTSVLSKSKKGYYGYAKELNLEIKDSETTIGKKYEYIAYEILENKGYDVIQMPQNFPYDILINKTIKTDVKFSYLYKGHAGNFYSFNLEKPYCTCDIYILITKADAFDKNTTYRVVPSKFVYNNSQISIGEGSSKYDRYINQWEYIKQYDEFYKQVV